MKRLLLSLVPWMVAIGAAASETSEPAEVAYTHVGLARSGVYRINNECFVSPDVIAAWGWTATIKGFVADIQAEGSRFEIPIRMYKDLKLIPLQAAIRKLGGGSAWRGDTNTLDVWGVVKTIEAADGRIVVESTLAAKPKVFYLRDPARLVVDLAGIRLDDKSKVLLTGGARAGQFQSDTLRIVMPSDLAAPGAPKFKPASTRKFEYALNTSGIQIVSPNQTDDPIELPPDAIQQEPIPEPPPKTTSIESGVPEVVSEQKGVIELRLRLTGDSPAPANYRRVDPENISVWLPGAQFAGDLRARLKAPGVESWAIEQKPNGAIYTFKLSRPMGIEFSVSGREIRLVLHKPDVGNGKLAGKTIVVDAGHGGNDTGARSPSKDTLEKNLTLSIAKLLSQKLAAQGATVIMTRKTDVFIPLKERSEIANRAGADLFVSVHINSSLTPNRTSGGITFFHKRDPIGQLLADCVQGEIGKVSGLPSLGTWSDTRIYGTGFAVLRLAKMPAILIEVGFINHNVDRGKMVTSDFQEALSKAIVKGVRVYLGDVKTEEN